MIDLMSFFPEINDIENTDIRNKTLNAWEQAVEEGGWQRIDNIPFTLLIPDTKHTLVNHTKIVYAMAVAAGLKREDIDMDVLRSGALLHDVGKLLEYEYLEGRFVKSEHGRRVRHPVSGYNIALKQGLPLRIAHIILAHSKEGEYVKRIPEAIIVHHADFIDFEIEKFKQGM